MWEIAYKAVGGEPSALGTPEHFSKLIGNNWKADAANKLKMSATQISTVERIFEDIRDAQIHPYQWANGILRQLSRRAVVSFWTNSTINSVRKHFADLLRGPHPIVTAVIGAECVSRLKPDPEGGKQLLEMYTKIPLEQVILIGDDLADYEAAQSLGIDFAVVSWGSMRPAEIIRILGSPSVLPITNPQNLLNLTPPSLWSIWEFLH